MTTRILFAVAPLMLLAALVSTSAQAGDDLLSRLAASELNQAEDAADTDDADLNDAEMGLADVEALMNEGEDVEDEKAIAACYRRFGRSYGYRSYGHTNYGYSNYGYSSSYSHGYTPSYYSSSYRHYTPSYCYTPVTYSYCTAFLQQLLGMLVIPNRPHRNRDRNFFPASFKPGALPIGDTGLL